MVLSKDAPNVTHYKTLTTANCRSVCVKQKPINSFSIMKIKSVPEPSNPKPQNQERFSVSKSIGTDVINLECAVFHFYLNKAYCIL